jgi:P4 family phage/plasmid primase-like protien
MAPEYVETFLDFAAYCLWRKLPYHKWLLLNGSGRNGKGVVLLLLSGLLGQKNITSESLQKILENDFAVAELYQKFANIDADLSEKALQNTGILKKLTGNDYVTAEKKFKNPFQYQSYAKLIFSANIIPKTSDETDAFFARVIIINFLKQYLDKDADPYLFDKLNTEQEMSGLFTLLVSRLPKVLESGISGSDKSLGENYVRYVQSSDPTRVFVETSIEHITGDDAKFYIISKDDVYNAYVRYSTIERLNPESSDTFNRRIKKILTLGDKKILKDGIRKYYWIGLKLKDWKEAEEGQETLG